MNTYTRSGVYLLLLLIIRVVNGQQGDFCRITSSGKNGQCQLISACPAALQEVITRGNVPQTCGFSGTEPIVCCEESSSRPDPTSTTSTTSTTSRPTPLARIRTIPTTRTPLSTEPFVVGDKSKQKCREYGYYVYSRNTFSVRVGSPPPTDECALAAVENIIGGENAKPKEFPHMALIGFEGENGVTAWSCGGSLISDKFVLTAGHCLYSPQFGEPKYVRLGELVLDTTSDDAKTQDFNIMRSIPHPDYNPPSTYNDIALLELDRPAELSVYVRPACLNTNTNFGDVRTVASGWGKVGYSGETSKPLLKVTLERFAHSECNRTYRNNIGIRLKTGIRDDIQLCVGSRNESKDACPGDSGGPLQITNSNEVYCTYKIIGVVSFGKACGSVNVPGVYTRVSAYIKWIEDIVWP